MVKNIRPRDGERSEIREANEKAVILFSILFDS